MWTSRYWQAELWMLAFIMFVLALIGSLFDRMAEIVGLTLLVYLVWNLIQLSRLFHWLVNSRATYPPSAPGLWGEIFNSMYNLQRKNKDEKKKFKEIISEFRASTRALKDGVLIIRNNGEIRWFNKAAENLVGLKAGADIGQSLFNLLRHPNFIEYEKARDYAQSLVIISPSDSNLILNIQITPYNDDQRLVIVRDVTAKHHLERVRQDFVANVSHELRTPLTVINGYLEMLDPELNPNLKDVAKPLNMMRQQALNMAHLVDDLLLLSKLDNKAKSNTLIEVDVNLLLDSICAEAQAFSANKKQQILFHSYINLKLHGVEKQLRSAFSNLIFNAVRYTPEKGNIDVFWLEEDGNLIMKVKDDGPGIQKEHLPRLTERFYRVDSGRNRDQGGTGLGLAIVKHVMEYHGAELKIQSVVGEGSCFSCFFPNKNYNS